MFRFPIEMLRGSELKTPYQAPEEGYKSNKTWHRDFVISNSMYTPDESPGNVVDEFSKNVGLFFRLRTVIDENGNIIRANYAKFYGDPIFDWDIGTGEGAIFFQHVYYNPEVNDRNLEFDRDNNLFDNLKSRNQPRYP